MDRMRMIGGFVAAVLVTVVVAGVAHTNFTIRALRAVGAEIPSSVVLDTVGGDLVGLAPALGAVVAIALLLGFLVAGLARRVVRLPRPIAFAIAGGAAFGTALWLMRLSYAITPLASARTTAGFLALCAAGALGGLVFASVSRTRTAR